MGREARAAQASAETPDSERTCRCGQALTGRRRHARSCSGACRAVTSRRRRLESARRPFVRFLQAAPGAEPEGRPLW